MPIKPLMGLTEQWFTPEQEQGEATPTQFKIKPLDSLTFLDVMSNGTIRADGSFIPNRAGREMLLNAGLVGWRNFGDAPFDANRISQIPPNVLAEICNEIVVLSNLSEDDEKN